MFVAVCLVANEKNKILERECGFEGQRQTGWAKK